MFSLKHVAVALGLTIAALSAFVYSRPDTFQVERSATIMAPADVVYAQVSDFHAWNAWSPWEALDPSMKKVYSGENNRVGAGYFWDGNDKVGSGRMTIASVTPPTQIDIKLEFIKPWPGLNDTRFTFAPDGDKTKVTWSMSGQSNFMMKAMTVFMNMDKMVGSDFERGLAKLGEAAQSAHKKLLAEAVAKAAEEAQKAEDAKKAAEAAATAGAPVAAPPASPAP